MSFFYTADIQAEQCCGGGMRGWMNYNTATVETITGTVADIGTFQRGGVHISLKTNKETIVVHLGPDFYVNEKIKLAKGDAVTISGSRIKYDGKDAIIAKTLVRGDLTVKLRNEDGTPLWSGRGNRHHWRW